MPTHVVRFTTPTVLVLAIAGLAGAQTVAPTLKFSLPDGLPIAEAAANHRGAAMQPTAVASQTGEWRFNVYPILLWVPTSVGIEVDLPFDIDGGDNGGIGSRIELVDTRFDGAAVAGFSASDGTWRFDVDGVYAAVGGDRVQPNVTVDLDLTYGHGVVGRKLVGDLFVTGGVRRLALKYDIDVEGFAHFSRKPGIWDPLIGLGYHKVGRTLELHLTGEYGGFGVGADSDLGVGARLDWKPWSHFGFTVGYSHVRLRFKEDIGPFEFSATQHIGGPIAGIGLYF